MIRIILPQHLQTLAGIPREVGVEVAAPVTQAGILTALETRYPTLRGAIRDRITQKRRPMIRFCACQEDVSNDPPDAPVPEEVASGTEPFYIIGAIAGGVGPPSKSFVGGL
jgi:hypothetical protein